MTLGREDFIKLMEDVKAGPEIYRPSAFWSELTDVGLRQLESGGFDNFKRTVNMTYFNWGVLGILRHQFVPVFLQWLAHPSRKVLQAQFPKARSQWPILTHSSKVSNFRLKIPDVASFDPVSAFIYRTYVAMFFDLVSREDKDRLLSRIDEPSIGNPFAIFYRGIQTSQDLCNSVHEYYSCGASSAPEDSEFEIAELGSGYGRLAYVCLRALPHARYTLIDIPPALNVAQEYLTRVFPDEKAFRYRKFSNFSDVEDEFRNSRFRFLAAHQIELLPPKSFDLFINISSLHEMSWSQIENYLRQIDRTCRGRFYTKQWLVSQASINGVVVGQHDYPIPSGWREVFHRRHPIQRKFFEALYEVASHAG